MFSVTMIAVGKLKERFYLDAAKEYATRLGGYCRFTLCELQEVPLPDAPSRAQIDAALQKEALAIRKKIPKGSWVCVLTPEGTQLSSEALAQTLQRLKTGGCSAACFILGSSFGLDASVKALAQLRLSMSKMTFPHHLARIMALEQLYRAETIQAGAKYHK